jgi:hypothetical protein
MNKATKTLRHKGTQKNYIKTLVSWCLSGKNYKEDSNEQMV